MYSEDSLKEIYFLFEIQVLLSSLVASVDNNDTCYDVCTVSYRGHKQKLKNNTLKEK